MQTHTFKTTINCANCVRAITPALAAEPGITAWHVDTASPARILTVRGDVSAARITELLADEGFEATAVGADAI